MDEKVLKYRQKHKRCKYCKYLVYRSPRFSPSYIECKAKDKLIGVDIVEIPRWFCSCYEVDVNKC